jgi:hypothetical protein
MAPIVAATTSSEAALPSRNVRTTRFDGLILKSKSIGKYASMEPKIPRGREAKLQTRTTARIFRVGVLLRRNAIGPEKDSAMSVIGSLMGN